MTQPTNTYDSYDGVNTIRESLHNVIFNISPVDTPILSAAQLGQGTATNTLHEWINDTLAAADGNNARVEGDDKDGIAITAPSRLINYCQISDKTIVLSGTQRAVNNVGTNDEFARQVAKKAQELKRDMETIITGNQAAAAGDATTARKLRSLEAWYVTANSNRGTGGSAGTTTLAATDATTGDLRGIQETFLKDVLQKVFTAGGNPDLIVAGPVNKQRISGFAGNSNRQIDATDATIFAGMDVYVSDFGRAKIVPNRFSRARTVHVVTGDMLSIDFLRPMYETDLSKTGDSDKKLLGCEYTLRVNAPAAHGVIADLTS
jgi:hypothetical protein